MDIIRCKVLAFQGCDRERFSNLSSAYICNHIVYIHIYIPVAWKMPYFQSQGVNQVFWICDDVLYRLVVVCHPSKKSSRLTFLKITRGTPPALSPQFSTAQPFHAAVLAKAHVWSPRSKPFTQVSPIYQVPGG